jgi:hypothetical protein
MVIPHGKPLGARRIKITADHGGTVDLADDKIARLHPGTSYSACQHFFRH